MPLCANFIVRLRGGRGRKDKWQAQRPDEESREGRDPESAGDVRTAVPMLLPTDAAQERCLVCAATLFDSRPRPLILLSVGCFAFGWQCSDFQGPVVTMTIAYLLPLETRALVCFECWTLGREAST